MSEDYSFDNDFSYDEDEDRYQLWLEQHEDDYYWYDSYDSDDELEEGYFEEPNENYLEDHFEESPEEPQEFGIEIYSEYCQNFIKNLLK